MLGEQPRGGDDLSAAAPVIRATVAGS